MKKLQQGLGAWLASKSFPLCTREDLHLNSWYPSKNQTKTNKRTGSATQIPALCQMQTGGQLGCSGSRPRRRFSQKLCFREIRQSDRVGHPTSSCGLCVCLRACTCAHTEKVQRGVFCLDMVNNLLVVCDHGWRWTAQVLWLVCRTPTVKGQWDIILSCRRTKEMEASSTPKPVH